MENQEFDQFVRESVGAPTRRTLVRGLAAVLGVSGLSLVLASDTEAGKRQNKRNQKRKSDKRKNERKKKEKKRKEKREKKHECGSDGKVCPSSTNPCQTIACEDHKCVTSNVANGTACGGGRTCSAGSCGCPTGATCEVKVSPSSLNGWTGYDDNDEVKTTSFLNFVNGPDTPPYGNGSVEIDKPANERYALATYQFAGTRLSDITSLKFTSFNPAGGGGGVNNSGFINFNIDFDGSDVWQYRLVYVPSVNGTVEQDQWQEWDGIDGGDALWSYSKQIGGVAQPWPGVAQPLGTVPKTWSQILNEYPQARVLASDAFFGIRIGLNHTDQYAENINSVTFGTSSGTRFVFGPDS